MVATFPECSGLEEPKKAGQRDRIFISPPFQVLHFYLTCSKVRLLLR